MGVKSLNAILMMTGLVFAGLNMGLGAYATGQVPAAVEDAVALKVKDDICENQLCSKVNEDWAESTSERDFYAWHILNLDEVENGSDPKYETIGPVTYDVTLKKEVDNYDVKNGLLTYKQTTSYACSKETKVPCSTEVTQLNIAFNPQVVGATGTAINTVMETTKTGFASGVIDIHFKQVSAAYEVASYNQHNVQNLKAVEGNYPGAIVNTDFGNSAESYYLDGMFDLVDEAYGDAFLNDDTTTYLQEGGVRPEWNSSDLDLNYAFREALGPSGEDISLLNYMGPLVYASMGEPESLNDIQADPENSITLERAELWDFEHPTDLNITLSRDWTLYAGMGKLMQDYGALDDDYLTNDSEDAVNLSIRAKRLLDLDIDNDVARTVLTLGDETDEPLGILAVSESGTSFGLTEFLEMNQQEAMDTYGINSKQHEKLKQFCNSWAKDISQLPLILVGGEGYMTASGFVNTSFGAEDPVNGGYLEYSLNVGGNWGSGIYQFPEADPVDISANESANILFGQWGLTTYEGASMFLYGELSGKSLPINYSSGEEAIAMEWTNETVAEIYDIDENSASAIRLLMMEVVFKNLVPENLIDGLNTSRYLTQSVNNWLLGWHDPVNAYLETGDPENMTAGWTSLEANETFFGSDMYVDGGISTGDPALITICTGEVDTCDKGETVMVGDSEYVSWRTQEKEEGTFGLIKAEKQGETTGGFITGDEDLVDLSGYGTAEVECSKEDTLKGIPVDVCTASMDPLTRPIQAKLINNGTLLDVIPGTLPVYFGSDVELKVEQLSGAIIAGKSESTFWLDKRPMTEQQTPPTMNDLQEVFVIKTSGELDDETAEKMESQIVTNQDTFAWFTNFDHWSDYVGLTLWILAGLSLLTGFLLIFKPENEEDSNQIKWADDSIQSESVFMTEGLDENELKEISNDSLMDVPDITPDSSMNTTDPESVE
ncbi:MAG: hypothetical protein DWC02_07460 [Candidatus Poseidoniales archaeon]|nr:MAG: hypothetical protein DWC02_07460 [Candidatus Poseidoniales archaeon]